MVAAADTSDVHVLMWNKVTLRLPRKQVACHGKAWNISKRTSELGAGAGRGNRTPKGRSPADFESAASASSAIPAKER